MDAAAQEISVEEQNAQIESDRSRLKGILAEALLGSREEAIIFRASSGIERRWREDEAAHADPTDSTGNAMLDYATGEAIRPTTTNAPARRSQVVVNIIRGKVETAVSRFCDIIQPTDMNNWALRVTPFPELSDQLSDDRPAMQAGQKLMKKSGEQYKVSEVVKDKLARAQKSMGKMETYIEDQLTECDYNGEQRKMIIQSCKLGTGILKGPTVRKRFRNQWVEQTDGDGSKFYALKRIRERQPSSVFVDCWNVFPSPGTTQNIQQSCEYIWEREEILPRDLRKLIGVDGYDEKEILAVLMEEPKRCSAAFDEKAQGRSWRAQVVKGARGQAYEMWTYHGDVSVDVLSALGVQLSPGVVTKDVSACVVFVNDRPIKVDLNLLDTGELPYDFFQWSTVDTDTPWGIGVPRQMIWLQRIITAAWRQMMDNAGDSAGANIVINKVLHPADGVWEFGGKKIWINHDDMEDAQKAFAQFQIQNNQQSYEKIIELALRFVDLETTIPSIFNAEVQEIPETLGATNIMVDASNVGLRGRVKIFDDQVTDPHLTRYYHWNMMYHPDHSAKGDFQVDARGVRVLFEMDQQAQVLLQVMSLKGDPDVRRAVNWDKAIQQFLRSKRLDVLKTDEELKAYDEQQSKTEQPVDPAIETAKIRVEGELKREQMRQEAQVAEDQYKAQQAELDRKHQMAMRQIDQNIEIMRLSNARGINIDKIKAQLAISGAGMKLQKSLSREKRRQEVSDRSVPEMVTPPTEPAGRAPVGQSFER